MQILVLIQVFTVIKAMSDGAVQQGIDGPIALRMAAQTVSGAAQMVLQSGKHPAELRDKVIQTITEYLI